MKHIKKIVLVINKIEREKRSMEMIKNALIELNNQTHVKLIQYLDKNFIPKIIDFKPNIVLSFPFTAFSVSTKFYILKYLLNFTLVSLRTEGLILKCDEKHLNLMAGKDKYGKNLVDHEIFWGPESAELIGEMLLQQNKLSSKERIQFFGAPSFEDYNRPNRLPDCIENKLNLYDKNKILLITTGFQYAEYSETDVIKAGDLVDQKNDNFINDYINWLCYIEKCKVFRNMWIHTIDLCSSQNPELFFVIKMHPLEINVLNKKCRPNPYDRLNNRHNVLLIRTPIPIKDIIQRCGLLFHYGSTAILEAYLNGVPSVYVESKDIKNIQGTINPFDILDIPSDFSIDLVKLPFLINSIKIEPVKFERKEIIEKFLKRQLCLSLSMDYKPSERIANFLLKLNQQPQRINHTDRYLYLSLKSEHYDNYMNQYLLSKSYECIQTDNFSKAIQEYLHYLGKLLKVQKICVINYYYYLSICLYNSNMLDQAISTIQLELKYFPSNGEAKKFFAFLLNKIENNS